MKKTALSIIVTMHHEGIIAHKTILSLQEALNQFPKKINYEIILHVDNGDELTRQYVSSYETRKKFKVFYNNFGDPSLSRNYAMNQSSGEYVFCIDGDDLISKNFLYRGYELLGKNKKEVVLHAEMDITFGYEEWSPRIWWMKDSFSDIEDTLILFGRNRWCSGTYMRRETAIKYQYAPADNGFGYEDWWFNSETRANGIKHLVIPNTTMYHRVKKESTYKKHISDNVVVEYTSQFETKKMQEIANKITEYPERPIVDTNKVNRRLSYIYGVIKKMPAIKKISQKLAKKTIEKRYNKMRAMMPDFLFDQWAELNKIDNSLYPDREIVARIPIYTSEYDYLGRIYCKLVSSIRKDPDYVIMPPELNIGGTEKVIVNYLWALKETHPNWHIVVLSTLAENHPYNIPSNVDFVDFIGITKNLSDYDRRFVLDRFIVQTKVKRLHLINNEFYYRWASSHKKLLKENNYKLYVSHFMHEYTEDPGRTVSFADPHISELYPCIEKIFTDNKAVIDEALSYNAFDSKKFSVHYQPVQVEGILGAKEVKENQKMRILWASRVSLQKRPDILKEIAKKLEKGKYQIDVYGRFQKPYTDRYFKECKNIKYCGTYRGIESLDVSKYDAFLYTSQTDGLPNVLLEIGQLGLPIIASNDGGVSDIIEDEKTGRLIEIEDIDGYVEAIKDIKNNSDKANKMAENLNKIIRERHTMKNFIDMVKKDIK